MFVIFYSTPLPNGSLYINISSQMEEEQIITVNDLSSDENTKSGRDGGVNKTLLGVIVLLLLVISGGGAYFFGVMQKSDEEGNTTPTESPFKAETLGEETEVSNEENVNPAASEEATPTIDPLITPSITPTTTPGPTIYINPNLKVKDEIKIILPTSTPSIINPDVFQTREIQIIPQQY